MHSNEAQICPDEALNCKSASPTVTRLGSWGRLGPANCGRPPCAMHGCSRCSGYHSGSRDRRIVAGADDPWLIRESLARVCTVSNTASWIDALRCEQNSAPCSPDSTGRLARTTVPPQPLLNEPSPAALRGGTATARPVRAGEHHAPQTRTRPRRRLRRPQPTTHPRRTHQPTRPLLPRTAARHRPI